MNVLHKKKSIYGSVNGFFRARIMEVINGGKSRTMKTAVVANQVQGFLR